MKPIISIIMGSTSDLPVMEKACKWLEQQQIPFELNALSAHRTPDAVREFAQNAKQRGIKVIIAGAGMAAGQARQLALLVGKRHPASSHAELALGHKLRRFRFFLPEALLGADGQQDLLFHVQASTASSSRRSSSSL